MKKHSLPYHSIFLLAFILYVACSATGLAQQSTITKKNEKRNRFTKKSEKVDAHSGQESIYKKYNNSGPKPSSKLPIKKVNVSKEKQKQQSGQINNNVGDIPNYGVHEYSDISVIIPPNQNVVDKSKMIRKGNSVEAGRSVGDIPFYGTNEYSDISVIVPPGQSVVDKSKMIRREKAAEAGRSQGDANAAILYRKELMQIESGYYSGNDKGELPASLVTGRKSRYKGINRELSSNQGDIIGGHEKKKNTEKVNAKKASVYQGTINMSVYTDRNKLEKQNGIEMGKNTGDVNGTYMDMKNRMKKKSVVLHSYSGDVLTKSLEARKTESRNRSKKPGDYKGEIILKRQSKGKHPSAIYADGRLKKSIEEKERMRKRVLKRSRKHRDEEDPIYMKKEQPRPRFDTREYQIWETKTRDGGEEFMMEKDRK